MHMPLAELALMLFFLSGLTILSRSRSLMIEESRSSYNHMYGGMIILNFVALLRLSASTGLTQSIPFFAEPPFMQLIQTIGLITGLVLLVSGVSDWLPLNKMLRRYGSERIGRLELLKDVQQFVSVEGRLPEIISSTLKRIIAHLPIERGICWQFASGQLGRSTVITEGFDNNFLSQLVSQVGSLNRTQFNSQNFDWNGWLEKETGLTEESFVLPIRVEQDLIVLYALYGNSLSNLQNEDKQILRMLADLIASYARHEIDSRNLSHLHKISTLQNSIVSGLNHLTDTKERFTLAANKLKAACGSDIVTMISLSSGCCESDIYTLERTGFCSQRMIDRSSLDYLHLNDMKEAPRLMTSADSDRRMMSSVFGRTDVRSTIVLPLYDENGLHGLLAVGRFSVENFLPSDMHLIRQTKTIFVNMIKEDQSSIDTGTKQRRLARLVDFQTFSRSFSHPDRMFQHAAGLLSDELGCEIVRISTFEEYGAFLKSRAMRMTGHTDSAVPQDGYQVLSLMPYHRLVHQTGRVMLINQELSAQKISDGEASQLYKPGLRSVMLVPFGKGTAMEGIIAIADSREWQEFHPGEDELVLASGIAGVLTSELKNRVQGSVERKPISRRTLTLRRDEEVTQTGVGSKNLSSRYIPSQTLSVNSEKVSDTIEMQTTGR